jgi:hypothetical protein
MNFNLETKSELRSTDNRSHFSSDNDLKNHSGKSLRTKELVTNGNHPKEQKLTPQVISTKLRYDQEGLCINAFHIATSPEVLKIAYETIKSKPGNMVQGSDTETLDGIS